MFYYYYPFFIHGIIVVLVMPQVHLTHGRPPNPPLMCKYTRVRLNVRYLGCQKIQQEDDCQKKQNNLLIGS